VDAERVAMLDLDVDARRRQYVVGDEIEAAPVARADRRHDVAVRRQADRAARRRHPDDGRRRGGVGHRRAGGDEHDRRRAGVVRHDHRPRRTVDERHVRQTPSLAVTLVQSTASSARGVVDVKNVQIKNAKKRDKKRL